MIQSIISFFSDLAMFMLLLVVMFTVFAAFVIAPKYEKNFQKNLSV